MRVRTTGMAAAVAGALAAGVLVGAAPAQAVSWKNCDAVHRTYPHGVGKVNARDHTSGTPVTNFKRSTALYKAAMKANSRLDGDKDGIACESA